MDLVSDGLVTTPERMVINDSADGWRPATDAELLAAGRLTIREREILDGDYVRMMTPAELDERGLLTDEERAAWVRQTTMQRLDELDRAATRPLRAIAAGTATNFDRERLVEIEAEAEKLREELRSYGTST